MNFKLKRSHLLITLVFAPVITLSNPLHAAKTNVNNGEVTNDFVIDGGDQQNVFAGGVANDTVINGGTQNVFSGLANGSVINADGAQLVERGGVANDTVINGGTQTVLTNSLANGSVINADGRQNVSGVVNGTVINGGIQNVFAGGLANGSVINADGGQNVRGVVNDTVINFGGQQTVTVFGIANDTVINANGVQRVEDGGLANGSVINADGWQNVNGVVNGTVINGGIQNVDDGGIANDTVINAGGGQDVWNGGVASNVTIDGGLSYVHAGGNILGLAQVNTGTLILENGVSADIAVHTGGELRSLDSMALNNVVLNGGMVSLNAVGAASQQTLSIQNLSGNGTFTMDANLAEGKNDLLKIQHGEGNHQLLVKGTGAEPTAAGSHKLVQIESGNAEFSLANQGGVVDMGTYQYVLAQGPELPIATDENRLAQSPETDWYLKSTSSNPGPVDPSNPNPGPGTGGDLSSTADAAIAQTTVSSLWFAENDALLQRMGELRNSGDEGGMWIRGFALKQEVKNGVSASILQRVQGTQVGVDHRIEQETGNWYVGAMGGYTYARRDYRSGNGSIDAYSLGVYASYIGDDGRYFDATARLSRYQNDYTVTQTDGSRADGAYHQSARGFSLEAGQKIQWVRDWFVEPSAKFAFTRADSVSYTTSNGMFVEAGGTDSSIVEVSVRLGRDIAIAGDKVIQPYVKAGYLNELANKTNVATNGNQFKNNLSGGGGVAGFGVAMKASKESAFYADFEHINAKSYDQRWSVNAGYRLSW